MFDEKAGGGSKKEGGSFQGTREWNFFIYLFIFNILCAAYENDVTPFCTCSQKRANNDHIFLNYNIEADLPIFS